MRSSRDRFAKPLLVAVLIALLSPSAALAASPGHGAPPKVGGGGTDLLARDSWIVTLDRSTGLGNAPGLAKLAGGSVGLTYGAALHGFQLKGSAAAAAALARLPGVVSVEADRPIQLTETLPFGVERIDAWTFSGDGAYQAGYTGAGARIAILDTGIDLDHPDLAASIDQASGLNCLNGGLPPNDGHGHGTHVSGTAAAPLNGVGVVGVAPEATLVPIKMFDDAGNSSEAYAVCALNRVVVLNTDANPANDVDVANMSWGEHRAWGDCASDALHSAICAANAAGVVLVGGAGNDATDAGDFVPAAFPEVISVSAFSDFDGHPGGAGGCQFVPSLFWFECDDSLAFFTDYGSSVDVTAPGVNIHSTWAGGGYNTIDGTSMATPHVAGTVALMAAAHPGLTLTEARGFLRQTGECPNGAAADADGTSGCAGQGTWPDDPDGIAEPLVNAARAAAAAGGAPPPPPPPPPEPTAPGAPILVSASGGVATISLSWTAPADGGSPITGYEVWRSTTAGAETLLTSLGVQQSYVDAAVVSGTTYWYAVLAVNAVGPSPLSNERSAALITTPSAPTLLGAATDGGAILSWTAPVDDGGSAISGYNVYRSVNGGAESLHASTGAGDTTFVEFGLTNGISYGYRVAAVNAAGPGAFSNAVTIVPTGSTEITAPDPPQGLTISKPKGTFSLKLTWAAPADDGGSPVASYFVYRRAGGEAAFTLVGLTDGSTLTWLDESVARRTLYTYYVTAFNSYEESAPSTEASTRSK